MSKVLPPSYSEKDGAAETTTIQTETPIEKRSNPSEGLKLVDKKFPKQKQEEKSTEASSVSKYVKSNHSPIVKWVLNYNLDHRQAMMLAFSILRRQVWE
jgi:hypothetical protein